MKNKKNLSISVCIGLLLLIAGLACAQELPELTDVFRLLPAEQPWRMAVISYDALETSKKIDPDLAAYFDDKYLARSGRRGLNGSQDIELFMTVSVLHQPVEFRVGRVDENGVPPTPKRPFKKGTRNYLFYYKLSPSANVAQILANSALAGSFTGITPSTERAVARNAMVFGRSMHCYLFNYTEIIACDDEQLFDEIVETIEGRRESLATTESLKSVIGYVEPDTIMVSFTYNKPDIEAKLKALEKSSAKAEFYDFQFERLSQEFSSMLSAECILDETIVTREICEFHSPELAEQHGKSFLNIKPSQGHPPTAAAIYTIRNSVRELEVDGNLAIGTVRLNSEQANRIRELTEEMIQGVIEKKQEMAREKEK